MYNRIYKNYQINVGATPFTVLPSHVVKPHEIFDEEDISGDPDGWDEAVQETPEQLIERATKEAELLLQEARMESASLMESAQVAAEQMRDEAHRSGFAQGFEEGRVQAESEYETLVRSAREIRDAAETDYRQLLAGLETEAVELVLAVARTVVAAELMCNPADVLSMIVEGFDRVSTKSGLILRVSPDDYLFVVENRQMLMDRCGVDDDLEIRKDMLLTSGGCIVETRFGMVDSGSQTRLDKIEEAFRNMLG